MNETWKPIAGYEGRYEVSDLGRVRSCAFMQRYLLRNGVEAFRLTKPRIVAQQVQNSGYALVHLHLNNKRTAKTVHRLVAEAFVSGAERTVNHKNGVKLDNRAANLEWVSMSDNHRHAYRLGLKAPAGAVLR